MGVDIDCSNFKSDILSKRNVPSSTIKSQQKKIQVGSRYHVYFASGIHRTPKNVVFVGNYEQSQH